MRIFNDCSKISIMKRVGSLTWHLAKRWILVLSLFSQQNGTYLPFTPDLEVWFITASSLMESTNALIDALTKRCKKLRDVSWSINLSASKWEYHLSDLKGTSSSFSYHSKSYQEALHREQKNRRNWSSEEMIECNLMRLPLQELKKLCERIAEDHKEERAKTVSPPLRLGAAGQQPYNPSIASLTAHRPYQGHQRPWLLGPSISSPSFNTPRYLNFKM